MRIDTKKTKVYKIDELSDEAKENAICQWREDGFDYEWWDFIYDDAITMGKLFGLDIDQIYFSGFSSQGDGACFEGNYTYKAKSIAAIKADAPKDNELHRIVKGLQDVQQKRSYSISASIKQSGHYNHSRCTEIEVDFVNENIGIDYYCSDAEDSIIELLRDYMDWIYKNLEEQWDYQNSNEAIIETLECNEYEFTEDGSRYI